LFCCPDFLKRHKKERNLIKRYTLSLVYICEYFNISLAAFFDEGTDNPVKVKELLAEAKGLDGDSLDLLIGTAKKMKSSKR